jgi:hypothetical protein
MLIAMLGSCVESVGKRDSRSEASPNEKGRPKAARVAGGFRCRGSRIHLEGERTLRLDRVRRHAEVTCGIQGGGGWGYPGQSPMSITPKATGLGFTAILNLTAHTQARQPLTGS